MSVTKSAYPIFFHRITIHLIVWTTAFLVFFLSLSRMLELSSALLAALTFFLPAVIPVYFHFHILEQYFFKKKFWTYGLLTILSIAFFGWFSKYLGENVVFTEDENAKVAGTLIIALFIVVSTGIQFLYEGVKQRLQLKEAEAKQIKAELKILKSQVNPHFLFNSLNNIYGLSLDQPQKVGESILKLSNLMRYILESSKKSKVSLLEEYHFLQNYVDMERLRLGDKCKIHFTASGDFEHKQISPLLFIPFVENSFKYGSFSTIRDSYIHIELISNEKNIIFDVENSINPSGRDDRPISTETGIDNVKKRLSILYPEKHELSISKSKEHFLVKLQIDL